MFNTDAISSAIISVINANISGITNACPTSPGQGVVYENISKPRDERPYVGMALKNIHAIGLPVKGPVYLATNGPYIGDYCYNQYQEKEFSVYLQYYGLPNDFSGVSQFDYLHSVLHTQSVRDYFTTVQGDPQFAMMLSEPTDITTLVGSKMEPRATMDMLFRMSDSNTFPVNVLTGVDMSVYDNSNATNDILITNEGE